MSYLPVEEIVEEPEEQLHSFIIRLWLEERDEGRGQGIWRGLITHVSSGTQRHFKELSEIVAFIGAYLHWPDAVTPPRRRPFWRRFWR